jgi:putative flippase GtrA
VRFWRFNAVGAAGLAVQLAVLALLVHAGIHYLAATAMAVEAAILHNFVWHERWTWADRPADRRTRLTRLLRFHALNGGVSLAGNLVVMRILVGLLGLSPLPANLAAVSSCAVLNFLLSDRAVFRTAASEDPAYT